MKFLNKTWSHLNQFSSDVKNRIILIFAVGTKLNNKADIARIIFPSLESSKIVIAKNRKKLIFAMVTAKYKLKQKTIYQ